MYVMVGLCSQCQKYLQQSTKFLLMESNFSAHDCLQSPKNLENIVTAWILETTICNQKLRWNLILLHFCKQGNLHLSIALGLAAECFLSNLSNLNRNGHSSLLTNPLHIEGALPVAPPSTSPHLQLLIFSITRKYLPSESSSRSWKHSDKVANKQRIAQD